MTGSSQPHSFLVRHHNEDGREPVPLKKGALQAGGAQCRVCEGCCPVWRRSGGLAEAGIRRRTPHPESVNLIAVRYHAQGVQWTCGWIILFGIAIELAYIGKAIGQTNKRLSALLKHINP
jgi:hypothetical protein